MQASDNKAAGIDQHTPHKVAVRQPPTHKAHAVQPEATPAHKMSDGELMGWSILAGVCAVGAVLTVALALTIIRFIWKRSTSRRVQPVLKCVDHGDGVFSFEERR